MRRVKHIVFILLSVTIMLLSGINYVYAQANTAGGPYIDSWHKYRVAMGGGTSYAWQIYPTETDANDATNLLYTLTDDLAWANVSDDGTDVTLDILFDDGVGFAPGTYFLVYAEYSAASCIARRILPITVSANNMSIVAGPSGDPDCNSLTGTLWDNSIEDISSVNSTITVDFTVSLQDVSGTSFSVDGWQITGSFTLVSGGFTFTSFVVSANSSMGGDCTFTGDEDGFTLSIDNLSVADVDEDIATITVTLQGDATSDLEIDMDIDSDGYAWYGSLDPGVYENGAGIKTTTYIRYGVPNTPRISVTP